MFYRISKDSTMSLTCQQVKDELMGEKSEDTLLFIVAKLLRYNDIELRRYLQQPYILPSSLMECKLDFILGEDNVDRLFQQAREKCTEEEKDRLTMKEFTLLYQALDPHVTSSSSKARSSESKEAGEDGDDPPRRTRSTDPSASPSSPSPASSPSSSSSSSSSTSVSQHSPSSSSSSSSPSSSTRPPVYRSSSSSSSKRAKRKAETGCNICKQNDRQSDILLCDRVDCTAECHYDCLDPPLSAIPSGSWFCADCKPLVKQALKEELSLVVQRADDERKEAPETKEDEDDNVMEITVEEWRQRRAEWQQQKEKYETTLAEKEAEMERLRAEVERLKRQSSAEERKESQEEHDERKEASPVEDEQKEPPQKKSKASKKNKRAGAA